MAAAVPWSVLEAVIAPHYPKDGPQGGRRPFPIALMLRIYYLQQWYICLMTAQIASGLLEPTITA